MSSTNGLKGKVKEIVTSMDAIRNNGSNSGRDIGLRQFMTEINPATGKPRYASASGEALAPEHLYSELGIDPQRTQVKELMDDEDNKYLVSEIIRDGVRQGMGIAQRELMQRARNANVASLGLVTADGGAQRFMSPDIFLDPINKGIVQATFYPDLVIKEEPVSGLTVTMPHIDLSDAALKDSGEAATIEEGTVTYGSKDVKIKKKARGLKVTYESIMFNSLSLAQIWFQDAGRLLGHTLNGMAVDQIEDGVYVGGTEAAAVIGVEDTDAGITWRDLARVAIQGAEIGRVYTQAIGNATSALNYIDMDEMKRLYFGANPMLPTQLKSPITMPESLYVSSKIAASQLLLNDPAVSLVQLTAMPLMTETEKIVSKQIDAAYTSIYTGFAKVMRTGSVIIDGSIAFSGNGFPTWMAPYAD
ncbi:MAG: hypothetical protein ABL959_09570 [Pyrinomonadaceae bacterium]